MNIPYRTRRAFRRLGIALLILLLIAAVIWFCWVIWLDRYVVYTRDGAKLDFSLNMDSAPGEEAIPPEEAEPISIYYNEGNNTISSNAELRQIIGYYITGDMLEADADAVLQAVKALPSSAAVMLDVKSIYGGFYYNTKVEYGKASSEVNASAVDELIQYLKKSGVYSIARLPAFRDQRFILLDGHDRYGLAHSSGMYCYQDDEGCYWMNPTSSATTTYLIQITNELRELGFNEVLFDEFRFPAGGDYYFDDNEYDVLSRTAAQLMTSCSTTTFAVSFVQRQGFDLPEGRTRLYMENVMALDVQSVAENSGYADPTVSLVFLVTTNDSRFDDYSVLRPLPLE